MTTPPMPEPESAEGQLKALSPSYGDAMTPFQVAIAAVLWRADYDSADIAHALCLPEATVWNLLTAIREAQS